MKTISFQPATYFPTTLSKVVGGYKGKGIYTILGKPGRWYIRAGKGWGYIATPAN